MSLALKNRVIKSNVLDYDIRDYIHLQECQVIMSSCVMSFPIICMNLWSLDCALCDKMQGCERVSATRGQQECVLFIRSLRQTCSWIYIPVGKCSPNPTNLSPKSEGNDM